MIEIVIDVQPKPTPRIKYDKTTGRIYNESWYRTYLQKITNEVRLKSPAYKLTEPLNVEIVFSKNCIPTSHLYGDIDNLVKGVLDACNDFLWKDDAQIVSINARKICSDEKKIILRIANAVVL